jgi:hypothetical protein
MNSGQRYLFGIFYDAATLSSVSDGFIPLDNTAGPKWLHEGYPIYQYLHDNHLENDHWFGFFSPRFKEKTGLDVDDIDRALDEKSRSTDACLFTSHFDQAALSLNVWLQGEGLHPGLLSISQKLANKAGYRVNLETKLSSLNENVFSHYLVAKGAFWLEWYRITSLYLKMLNADAKLGETMTFHRGKIMPIHCFIIERIPTLIFASGRFKASFDSKCYEKQCPEQSPQGILLRAMNQCKKMFLLTNEEKWLTEYRLNLKKYHLVVR